MQKSPAASCPPAPEPAPTASSPKSIKSSAPESKQNLLADIAVLAGLIVADAHRGQSVRRREQIRKIVLRPNDDLALFVDVAVFAGLLVADAHVGQPAGEQERGVEARLDYDHALFVDVAVLAAEIIADAHRSEPLG